MRFRPRFESLEDRCCPAITVQVDYSLDTNNFFNTAAKKAAMQLVADSVGELFTDNLSAITPGGINSWTGFITHPTIHDVNVDFPIQNLTIPANTYILYVGAASNFTGNTLADAGPGGFSAGGTQSFLDTVKARGQAGALSGDTDFGPWGGYISFKDSTNWNFNIDPSTVASDEFYFISFALHEALHAFGFGTADSFERLCAPGGTLFNGVLSKAAFDVAGGTPTVTTDHGHWSDGTTDGGQTAIMNAVVTTNGPSPKYVTGLDRAALGDLGWQLLGDSDGTLAGATDTNFSSTQTFTATGRSLDSRLDVDLYKLTASAGQQLFMRTSASTSGSTVDTFLRVFDAQGVELANDDNGGANNYSQKSFTFLSTGTYFVGVSAAPNRFYLPTEANVRALAGAGTGNYDLMIAADPTLRFTSAASSFNEDAGTVNVGVELTFASTTPITVLYQVSGGTAAANSDFTLSPLPIVIPPGQTTASIPVQLVDTPRDEADETVVLQLRATPGAIVSPSTHTLTILDTDPAPTVQLGAASGAVGEGPGSTFTINVDLSAISDLDVTIPFTLSGSATVGTDYTGPSSPLVIPAGTLSRQLSFSILGDALDEANEDVTVTLGTPTNATLGATSVKQAALIQDDDPTPSVQFTSAGQNLVEGAGATLTVQLSAVSGLTVTIPFTVGGTAANGGAESDFTLSAASPLTIPAGQTTATLTLTALTDSRHSEADETAILALGTPTNAGLGATATSTTTIENVAPIVQFTASTQNLTEGSTVNLTVQLSTASTSSVTIPFTVSGSAANGGDAADFMLSTSSPITIPAGLTTATISLTALADLAVEPNESVILTLGTPTNATLGATSISTTTIVDKPPPTVAFADTTLTLNEGDTGAVRVTLSFAASSSVVVPLSVSSTATFGADFTFTPSGSSLIIPAGQLSAAITLRALQDSVSPEVDESVTITLGTPTNAVLGANVSTTTIKNVPTGVEPGVINFASATASIAEDKGTLTLDVVRTNGSAGAVSVPFNVLAAAGLKLKNQATLGGDFSGALSGTIAFNSGETSKSVSFAMTTDNLVEVTESFLVTLSAPSGGATLGTQITATVDILDVNLPIVPDAAPNLPRLELAGSGFGKSVEHYRDFVTKAYAQFLGRLPDEAGFQFWVSLMQLYETSNHAQGLRQENIEAGFIDSPEYLGRNGGGANETWVRAIYRDLLKREADPQGVAFWVSSLQAGASPTNVALGFTASDERLRNRVTETYRTLLGREPDTFGLNFWIAVFKSGGTTEDINSGFVGSVEYYNKPDSAAGNPNKWIRDAYLDILFRPARVDEIAFWAAFLKG